MRWLFLTLLLMLCPTVAAADNCECCIASPGALQLIGDSQCAGSSMIASRVPETKQWATVKATCKGGTRIPYWVQHVDDVGLKQGDSVIVFLGSNDWGKPDPKPILKKIAASGAKCVWAGPPLIRNKDNGVANHLKKTVEVDGTCKFLDSRTLNLQLDDGVHPGAREHMRWLSAALSKLT